MPERLRCDERLPDCVGGGVRETRRFDEGAVDGGDFLNSAARELLLLLATVENVDSPACARTTGTRESNRDAVRAIGAATTVCSIGRLVKLVAGNSTTPCAGLRANGLLKLRRGADGDRLDEEPRDTERLRDDCFERERRPRDVGRAVCCLVGGGDWRWVRRGGDTDCLCIVFRAGERDRDDADDDDELDDTDRRA